MRGIAVKDKTFYSCRIKQGNDMSQNAIFWPMGALALLTFIVLTLIPFRRVGAARAGHVQATDFKYGESAKVPGFVSLANRNYMNLLEMPVLFYVICLMIYVSARLDAVFLSLAWGYVGLRTVHSLVHVSYNDVMHRLAFFSLSNFVVVALWVWFFFGR